MTGKIYLIADPHFGHANIIKYCDRPFENTYYMDRAIADNWNSVVEDDDEVIVMGDFMMGKEPRINCPKYLARLNGNKHLILGNHDKLSVTAYLDSGFLSVSKQMCLMDINDSAKMTVLRHHPPSLDELDELNDGVVYIYGHTHSTTDPYCVSVENINYTPILLEDLYKRIFLSQGKKMKTVCVPSCWPVEEDSVPRPVPTFTNSRTMPGDTIKYMQANGLL